MKSWYLYYSATNWDRVEIEAETQEEAEVEALRLLRIKAPLGYNEVWQLDYVEPVDEPEATP